jgi:hypothetical protein
MRVDSKLLPPIGTLWFYNKSPDIIVAVVGHDTMCNYGHVRFKRIDTGTETWEAFGQWFWHFSPLEQGGCA